MMPDSNVRKATILDIPFIHQLVCELAEYEKAKHEVTVDVAQYKVDFEEGLFEAFVIESQGQIIGTTIFYQTYSTWKGKMIYLEDFIIAQSHRKKGFGKKLFDYFIQHCRNVQANIVRWHVLNWNQLAIDFYDKYPVSYSHEWVTVKWEI